MKPARFSYHLPATVDEAVALLAKLAPDDGRIIAGGQSLVPTMAFRMAQPPHLIDINGIAELNRIDVEGDIVRIGAGVRHAAFEAAGAVPGVTGVWLGQVVRHIAHYPIRTRGTFCGSVANADPASEWCCVVAALDGRVVAESASGTRRIAAADYFEGVMATSRRDDELVTAVELPLLPDGTRCGFAEFSRRPGDFAIAMAMTAYRLVDDLIVEARIAIGGAEPFPRRIAEAEAALNGQPPTAAVFAEVAAIAAAAVDPMEDSNNTADYRRSLVRAMTLRALEAAA
ncbi:MAG: xanthine dehydrogenase family protein subunit M [Rhodopseudomonas sp.]|nr:xanthine dehydrogenase family protein subunit M [Rhodopseudomonas sp.]